MTWLREREKETERENEREREQEIICLAWEKVVWFLHLDTKGGIHSKQKENTVQVSKLEQVWKDKASLRLSISNRKRGGGISREIQLEKGGYIGIV